MEEIGRGIARAPAGPARGIDPQNMIGGAKVIVAGGLSRLRDSRTVAGSPPISDKGNATPSFIACSQHISVIIHPGATRQGGVALSDLSALLYPPRAARPDVIGGGLCSS
jgi:hypothetical protein